MWALLTHAGRSRCRRRHYCSICSNARTRGFASTVAYQAGRPPAPQAMYVAGKSERALQPCQYRVLAGWNLPSFFSCAWRPALLKPQARAALNGRPGRRGRASGRPPRLLLLATPRAGWHRAHTAGAGCYSLLGRSTFGERQAGAPRIRWHPSATTRCCSLTTASIGLPIGPRGRCVRVCHASKRGAVAVWTPVSPSPPRGLRRTVCCG